MKNKLSNNTSQVKAIVTQTLSSEPLWVAKALPWIHVEGDSYIISKITPTGQRKKLIVPKDIDILKESNSYFLSDLLKHVSLFKDLSTELIKEILRGVYEKHVKAGDVIVKQGEVSTAFYIVINGQFDVIHEGENGSNVKVNSLTGGDYFGEMALLETLPRQATITANTEGNLVVLNKETFDKIIGNSQLKNQLVESFKARRLELQRATSVMTPEDEIVNINQDNRFFNYTENLVGMPLNTIESHVLINNNSQDLFCERFNQYIKIAIDRINQIEEWEIINNQQYGLLNNVSANMSLNAGKYPSLLDGMDELQALVSGKQLFFIIHPKVIALFSRECTKFGIMPNICTMFDASFLTWRGIPIIPSCALPMHNTKILLIRVGKENRGVVGLHKEHIYNQYNIPSLIIETIEEDDQLTKHYLVRKYLSIEALSSNAIGLLDGFENI